MAGKPARLRTLSACYPDGGGRSAAAAARERETFDTAGWISEQAVSDVEISLKFSTKRKKRSHDRSHNETYNMITKVRCLRSLDSGPWGLDSVSPFLSSVKHDLIFCLRSPLSPCGADSSLFLLYRQTDTDRPPALVPSLISDCFLGNQITLSSVKVMRSNFL